MGKRKREPEEETYGIHTWNWENGDNEGGSSHESSVSEPSESSEIEHESEDDGEYKVADPKYAEEEGFYDNLVDYVSLLLDVQNSALEHEKNKTCIHRSKYTYNMRYLKMINADMQVKRTKELRASPFQYCFLRKENNHNYINLSKTVDTIMKEIITDYMTIKKGKKKAQYNVAMLDVVSLRLRNSKTGIESIMSLRNLVRTVVNDPPVDFFYSIGFLCNAVLFEK